MKKGSCYLYFFLLESIVRELGVHSVMPESKTEVPAFCSLLTKIAVSYLVAETGLWVLGSPLARIAIGEDLRHCLHFIGSTRTDEPPSGSLNELSHGNHARTGSTIVRIRLLAKLGTPTYFVAIPRTATEARSNHGIQRTP